MGTTLGAASGSLAATGDIGYQDQSYSGTSEPTGTKRSESVLWFNDGLWWANMWDTASGDFHIFRLDTSVQRWVDTGVPVDTRSNTSADTLWDGTHLYVASHRWLNDETAAVPGYPSYLFRYSYNSAAKTYSRDSGFPVQINNYRTETLVIDRDSTGTLWATWQQDNKIYVSRTLNGDDRTWGTPFQLPAGPTDVTVDDNSAVVAFGGNKIGVMWSNQSTANDGMWFAVHEDGDPATTWSAARTAIQGPNTADDHMNLKALQVDSAGRVYAAVKTSFSSSAQPLIMLFVRDPATGDWTTHTIARVSECPNRTIVLIDEENGVLHSYFTAPGPPGFSCNSSGGAIYEKTSPLASISFPTGTGTPVIQDADSPFMHNVSSTKQNVSSATGIALLARNSSTGFYWHHHQAISPGTPPSPPTASFSGTPTSGTAPVTVAFSDASTGSPTSWSWDFGDGASSTSRNPTHTYSTAGTYTVSLTVSNAAGSNTQTRADYVAVAAPPPPTPPTASFSGTPTSGTAPLTVAFSDASTGGAASWSWDFGDGGTSTSQNPTHTYASPGTYTVALTVTNASGTDTQTLVDYVTVTPPPPPTASFSGAATSGVVPLTVAFSDASSGSPTSWSWNFGDGATSSTQNPTHTYQSAGTYTVSLTVTNAGGSDTQTRADYITVTPPPPDFTVTASPAKQIIVRGSTTSYTVTLQALNDFAGAVELTVTGLPAGVTATFSANPVDVPTTKTSAMSVTTSSAMKQGSFTLTIVATSGSLRHSSSVVLQVKSK